MPGPQVTAVAEGSPAARAGVHEGDELVSVGGRPLRDVIEYARAVDEPKVGLVLRHGGSAPRTVKVAKDAGEPLGIALSSPVFDRVQTCDNHCAFCFIHQLPRGLRRSLYLKDDDYRLSFLYGNFTTLTRFTELDAERVLQERLGPLYVSIHATDPSLRAQLLRNPRGATSLRWLRVLLDGGIEVHGQIVVCPGLNDGAVLESTLADVVDEYPTLATLGVVPLGVSRYTRDPLLRPHTTGEAAAVCHLVEQWQGIALRALGRRLVFAADEYFLMAGWAFPALADYEGFAQHENGIGIARAFTEAFRGSRAHALGVRPGFFAAVDGAPATGYRAPRAAGAPPPRAKPERRPVTILTGNYGAHVLTPLVEELLQESRVSSGAPDVRILPVDNTFFGGNIGVAGLLTGHDIARALASQPEDRRYLLPDACLSEDRFLDGTTLADLPGEVDVVPADGASLREAIVAPEASASDSRVSPRATPS